ncbi:hypothetical protein BCR39DRAFT_531941 [Naematelia encephala]|uniref:DUF726-domain-containing protein n=1 Tax=Naematelia encephala TaxID=71784 RepID=A0A1Y2B3V8_9TREE|nr:hypothetical protein BCR39DRAFT_531941 [Naematelia encephala]
MIPAPRRTVSQPVVSSWSEYEDDDEWQDMPVVRSDDNPFGLDEEDQKRYHYRPPARLDESDPSFTHATSNATGAHLEVEADTLLTDSWRQKSDLDESDYTRLRLDEDEESEAVHMRTRYLFDDHKAMTPLAQMQATKELLTEGQRIAYVGLAHLVGRRMVRDAGRGWEGTKAAKVGLKGALAKGKAKAEVPVVESAGLWMLKIMARLYQHMEVSRDEQHMIESLAEHGVDAADLVPALMATHTVKNPEFDPQAKKDAEAEKMREARIEHEDEAEADQSDTETETDAPPPYVEKENNRTDDEEGDEPTAAEESPALQISSDQQISPAQQIPSTTNSAASPIARSVNPFGDEDDHDDAPTASSSSTSIISRGRAASIRIPSFDEDDDDDDGDIGRSASPAVPPLSSTTRQPSLSASRRPSLSPGVDEEGDLGRSSSPAPTPLPPSTIDVSAHVVNTPDSTPTAPSVPLDDPEKTPRHESSIPLPPEEPSDPGLPSLPGVSTSLTSADETVTLDIRWTVLCDLFLVLIADSVYDARSRVFLEQVASQLGFEWLDVVRFENRVTSALEIEESVEKTQQGEIIEGRRKNAMRKRYAMMGLAAVGGGLVIGLSAGLAAPLIGAGLAGALATVGVSGTSGFLAGAGGLAVITTGGVLTGANIAGQGMARRTREVRTFEFRPLHNNKRVSCYITVGGFMASKVDDVRLPFSTLDPIIGDVFSVLWEPEMMNEMGSALKILTSEIITQVGQQVLQATIMTALMSALQWPIILTKLGYLIDNPWSNALDRSRAAGLVLADVIIHRHAGVRPISLIGFSLGARAIFYALAELARVKAYGLVQDVFLFGATVTASRQTWLEVRSAVSGRFVNAYASNDWMLGYLFRATSGGLNTVAGLRPVEGVYGLENVEVTEIITGHMSYRSLMPQLLAKVGFPVTADYFDEPDDPELDMSVQERTIVDEEEEAARKNRKKILGIFPRRGGKSTSKPASGSTTPNPDHWTATRSSGDKVSPTSKGGQEEYDDDDLPPREEEVDIGEGPPASQSMESVATEDDPEARRIPRTAGFDFAAISRELGKDINVDKLHHPESRPADKTTSTSITDDVPPPERSGSAPPPIRIKVEVPAEDRPSSLARSISYTDTTPEEQAEDDGDIAATTAPQLSLADATPAWDRPITSPSSISPPVESFTSGFKAPTFGFNAWTSPPSSASASTTSLPLRAAPPARPHPPELMANPFAVSSSIGASKAGENGGLGSAGALGGWGKKPEDEQWATKNPW